ncbi:MAG: VIT1/CCC1 transporter family protein [Candidatus Nomurabacteria bacterium]|nr:VIT1/CCC1 transporter family protein [Candidatus Nomurabacteria bacterium]
MSIFRDPIIHSDLEVHEANSKMNSLRAAVLGANDGIVSVSSVVLGMAGATNVKNLILTAGVASLVAGALAMSVGEYVSVSSQRDTEKVLGTHPDHLTNPWHAAYASGISFFCGALIPIIAVLISPAFIRIPVVFISVFLGLIVMGMLSANAGGAHRTTAVIRVVVGGLIAMIVTFGVGKIFGVIGI